MTRELKVALLGTRGVPANYGAFELAADRIACLGGQRGIRWTVYCPEGEAAPHRHGRANLVYLPQSEGVLGPLGFDIRCLWHAARAGFDAVVMLGYGAGLFLLLPRVFGRAVITNTDGFEYKRSKWPWYAKLYFRYAEAAAALVSTGLISDSSHMATYYEKRYGRRSTFIAYGTDLPEREHLSRARPAFEAFLTREGLETRGYHVVAMRLEPENSIELIVEAGLSGALAHPILIIGPTTAFFERLRARVPEGSRQVRIVGPVYDRALLFLLRSHALTYVHGHTVGGINPAILEALSTGTPVVARDTPYNREVLEDSGLYFGTREDLVRGLSAVESFDESAWNERAASVAGKMRNEFTWEHVVEQYERLVRSVLD